MLLSRHLIVWVSAVVLAALAPVIVRAYAAFLERRTRARADNLLARFMAEARDAHVLAVPRGRAFELDPRDPTRRFRPRGQDDAESDEVRTLGKHTT